MKSAVETLSPTRAKLTVEVPFEELKPSLDAAYQKIAKQINVPGFRRGKVPPQVIDRQVGRAVVLDEAVNEVLPKAYTEALTENNLTPLAQPEIEVTKFEDNDGLEFTAEVDVKPEIDLPSYDGLSASVEDLEVTDEDVAEQVDSLRERFGTLSDVERAAQDGDFVVIDLAATQDGETVEGAEVSGFSYQVGKGGMIEGLDEALVGAGVDEEKTFTTQLVSGDLVGQDVVVQVKVLQVQEQELPELDDDFAQEASEFDTVEDWVDIYQTAGLTGLETETGPFEMMTPRGFLADEGVVRSLGIMGRVAARPAHVRKMVWLMPRMARAVPYLGYLVVAATRPV